MGSFQKLASLVLALLLLPGCGTDLPIYPVQGKIVLTDGDLKQLADAHVEFELEGSPTVRGSGLIASDGRFEVQMLHKGQVVQGLPAGKYRARLLFEDEGKEARKSRPLPVGKQFLDFKTSGLSVTVPASGEVTFTVAKR